MALINTTTTGIQGTTIFADGTGSLTVQQNGATLGIFGNQPAFSAFGNAQTVSNTTWTKVVLQNEEFDTNSNFDSGTNYRFTPTVAGYYQITGSVYYGTTTGGTTVSIYKNGSEFKRGSQNAGVSGGGSQSYVSALIYFNGSTDYVEFYLYQNSGGSVTTNGGAALQYFQGILIRAA